MRALEGFVAAERGCLYYAAFAVVAISKRGVRAVLQVGTASWRFKVAARDDDSGPTHYSYEFEPYHPLTVLCLAHGKLPELHCWAAIPETGEFIDLTTRHLPELLRTELPGEEWSAPSPSAYFWGQVENLPEGWRYAADGAAIRIAFKFLRKGRPEIHEELKARGLIPPENW